MSSSEEIEENTKVPETGILGKCTGLKVKRNNRINNWRIYRIGHVEESTKNRETQNRVIE